MAGLVRRRVRLIKVQRHGDKTLYRGEGGKGLHRGRKKQPWMTWTPIPGQQAAQEASGRWFTNTKRRAAVYANEFADPKTSRISKVRVSKRQYAKYRVSSMPGSKAAGFSLRPKEEWFVPKRVTAIRKTISDRSMIARIRRGWTEHLHPRFPRGTPGGGRFRRK